MSENQSSGKTPCQFHLVFYNVYRWNRIRRIGRQNSVSKNYKPLSLFQLFPACFSPKAKPLLLPALNFYAILEPFPALFSLPLFLSFHPPLLLIRRIKTLKGIYPPRDRKSTRL